MQTMGKESSMAVAIPVTMLVAPGPEVATATPTSPAGARVAVRHVRCALLVAHQHVVDLAVLQGVVDREYRSARDSRIRPARLRARDIPRECAAPVIVLVSGLWLVALVSLVAAELF